jgi:glutaminase
MACESNSVIFPTLANSGACPWSDERVFSPDTVQNLLSLKYNCSLNNNYPGHLLLDVTLHS